MTTLAISGPVGLAEAPRWRDDLRAALAGGEPIRIDLSAAGPWDLAGLQLIVSALKSGKRDGQAVRLVGVPKVFRDLVERAGGGGPIGEAIEDPNG